MARALPLLTVFSLLSLAFAGPARSQDLALYSYGIRAGASLDEDLTQVLVGGHVDLEGLAPDVRLLPLLTVGVGDDALSVLVGGEVHYVFPTDEESNVSPYAGGGVAVHHVAFDDLEDETDPALLVTGGVEIPVRRWWGWFAEGRFVIADATIFRLEGGINWLY